MGFWGIAALALKLGWGQGACGRSTLRPYSNSLFINDLRKIRGHAGVKRPSAVVRAWLRDCVPGQRVLVVAVSAFSSTA